MDQFFNQPYLNIETFRRNGQGIKTPVWFAEHEGRYYIWTMQHAGKVKRIRINETVNINPCKADGTVLGEWVPASAAEDDRPETLNLVQKLFKRKYGLLFAFFKALGTIQGSNWTTICLRLSK